MKYVPTATVRDMDDVHVFFNRFTNLIHADEDRCLRPGESKLVGMFAEVVRVV